MGPVLLVPPAVFVRPVAADVASPDPAALVRAALVALSRTSSFRTVTSSPSLDEVTVVEPRAHAEASTSHLVGPSGHGVLRVVVTGGSEFLEGNAAGLGDLLRLSNAPAGAVASVPTMAGTWFLEPASAADRVDRFDPSLSGIGHVFCTGPSCTLAGAEITAEPPGEMVVHVPAFGGDLVLDPTASFRPIALVGTGPRQGLVLRFAYPGGRPPAITAPTAFLPAPAALAS